MKISDYKKYFESVRIAVPGISKVLVFASQDQFSEKVRDENPDDTLLILIIPSSDTNSVNVDDVMENNTGLLFIVKFTDIRSLENDDFVNFVDTMGDVMAQVKQKMTDDKHDHSCPGIMHYFDPNNMHTDPEYDYYGTYGWSLSFNLLTPGY
jgi:hypothetical protein